MTVDVIMPSLKKDHAWKAIASLRYLPFGINFHLMTEENSWPTAINAGMQESKGDVLLMDDDIQILSETFSEFESYYPKADIFGFKLLFPNGVIQHAGGDVSRRTLGHLGYGALDGFDNPLYVSHVTASLMYIKKHVIDKIGMMAYNYPGTQFEDVDFSLRAIKAGFKILYIPGKAIHAESATKNKDARFMEKLGASKKELIDRFWNDESLMDELDKYPHEI